MGRAWRLATLLLLACRGEATDPTIQVAFVGQPVSGPAGAALGALTVSVTNGAGQPRSATVTLALHENRCGSVLSGTLTRSAGNGVARFDDLVIDLPQAGYRLEARAGGAQTISAPFDLTGGVGSTSLELLSTLCMQPNDQGDAESLALVPEDDEFWLADDNRPSLYHVARRTGAYAGRLDTAALVAALPDAVQCDDGDGNPATSCSYFRELETVTYDAAARRLYVINTVNNPALDPPVDKAAIFRLRKDDCTGCFEFDDWHELPGGFTYGAAVVVDGTIHLASIRNLHEYDYETNRATATPAYTAPARIDGLSFDGTLLWVLTQGTIQKVDWASRAVVATYALDAIPISHPRGLEVVGDTMYIVDSDPPRRVFLLRASAP